MKFTGSIEIYKPRDLVCQLFINPEHLIQYQDGFVRKELISGEQGKDGSVSKLYYLHNNRPMELTETIRSNRLPDSFEAFYHHKHMDNTMRCNFVSLSDQLTRFDYEFDYVRISWIIPRLMFLFFPGMFQQQGEKWMRQFKEFVERSE